MWDSLVVPHARLIAGMFGCCALVVLGGCSASKTVGATGSLLKTTVITTGNLAGQVLKTGGSLARTGVQAAADVVRPGLVTVVQESGKTVRKIPWKEGMTLYAATKRAELDAGVRAVKIMRGDEVIQRGIREIQKKQRDVVLKEGDVIKIIR